MEALSLMRKLSRGNKDEWDEPLAIEHDTDHSEENDINDEAPLPGRERSWKSVVLRQEPKRKSTKDANRRNMLWSYHLIDKVHE
jgi:hypothetical protein